MSLANTLTYGIEHALLAGKPLGLDTSEAITAATYEASFDQATTVTLTLSDPDGAILTSPMLAATPGSVVPSLGSRLMLQIGVDFFVLVKVSKSGTSLTLTFEDQVVNALRQIVGWVVKGQRSSMSRAGFCQRLALDPLAQRYLAGAGRIGFWSPELASNRQPDPTTGSKPPPGQPQVAANDAKSSQRPPKLTGSQRDWAAGLIVTDAGGTVVKLTQNMKDNAAICIATALGMRPKPPLVVLVSMLETIITEPIPPLTNTIGGDAASTGLYQQQIGPGFSWHGGTNREEATREYVAAAMTLHAKYPTLAAGEIAWRVQNPKAEFRGRYAQHEREAETLLAAYDKWVLAGAGGLSAPPGGWKPSTAPSSSSSSSHKTKKSTQSQGNEFSRSKTETSWDAIKRLADEVHWRAYTSGRVVMFAPDTFLLSVPAHVTYAERPQRDSPGVTLVDWIDFDFDTGKNATLATITLEASQIPAGLGLGSNVTLQGVGPASSSFLVSDIQVDFWAAQATLQVTAPRTPLTEAQAAAASGSGGSKTTSKTSKSAGQKAVAWAANFLGKPYHWSGGHSANGVAAMISYGDAQLTLYTTGFDCSGLVRCAWAQQHVDVGGATTDQIARATSAGVPHGKSSVPPGGWKAGDLFFPESGHVVMMTGDGTKAIQAPHTGDVIDYVDTASAWGTKPYFWCRWAGAGA